MEILEYELDAHGSDYIACTVRKFEAQSVYHATGFHSVEKPVIEIWKGFCRHQVSFFARLQGIITARKLSRKERRNVLMFGGIPGS
jgi:hypothetical protein